MWYFSWILGLGLACAFAILNAMWFELHADDSEGSQSGRQEPAALTAAKRRPAMRVTRRGRFG